MTLGPARWHVIAQSNFAWEREALEWLRAQLPDRDPWAVWSNFEFIDDEGKVNEVDALVLSPAGLFVVEIKSRPGVVTGDAHTWAWVTDGRSMSVDNPLLLTDRKSKRLASLLRRQPAVVKAKVRLPFIEPVVFLSSTALNCKLEGLARTAVFQRGRPSAFDDDGIVAALSNGVRNIRQAPVDTQQARAVARGLAEAGIRPSNKHRQVGDYQLVKLMSEGAGYQDWQAKHVSVDTVQRRVRIYTLASATSPEIRASRVRQARREFEILEGIDHPGILHCRDYKDTELGPALIFDHDPRAVRLDLLLRDHSARLSLDQRLLLVRSIAEVLQYAHSRRLFHRALGPQSVLVRDMATSAPKVRLMNWQTAAREAGTADTVHRTTGTRHVEAYVDDPGLVYLAPETARADPAHGAELDVFSLGALAFHIFSGQPPAASTLELLEKLRIGQGLRLSDVLDGCSARLHELIQYATNPDVLVRYDTVKGFLDDLDRVEDELTAPDPETTVDPSQARTKDRIEGGFTVVKPMGKGSSADALLVRENDSEEELVLKVASDAGHNDSLTAEGEALCKLRHPNIVEYRRTLVVAGRTALLLQSAGNQTLAEKLKHEGRLSLDMLQRFGEELLDAVRCMEDAAVIHRDIKPDNIGIAESRTGKLKLVLFDFSLSRTPPENLGAGTPPYLDPFLGQRPLPQRRWDLYAERFAAAVTLYEMAVGEPPQWGGGPAAPAVNDAEASIEGDVFDPVIREPLVAFFTKALRRDFRERFDNAEDMLRAWRAVFERAATARPAEPQGFEAVALTATPQTTMAELGYSLDAQDVLERMAIHDARELLAVDRIRFRYLRGVGDKIRKEIRLKAKDLARLRPDLTQGRGTVHGEDDEAAGKAAVTVNELAESLLPRRPAGDDRPEEAALAHFLGLDDAVPAGTWPALGESAAAGGVDRGTLTTGLLKARERWLKLPAFTELRHQLEALLASQGQVMTVHEAALALLSLRGCAVQDDAERLRLACALLRAALEAEAHLDKPRFEAFDHAPAGLIASSAAWADYARRLGTVADTCALADPLMPPGRVLEALQAVDMPAGAGAGAAFPAAGGATLPAARLLRLAASASRRAALSSRQEIYPRNMPALQALRQSLGALVGAPQLRLHELQDRVRGRYPQAQRLPGRPALDRLLEEAGAPLQWDPAAADGAGAYRRQNLGGGATAGTTTLFSRPPTVDGSGPASPDATGLEQRLQNNLRQGGLLVLTVEPRLARHAEAGLLRRFGSAAGARPGLQRLSFDALVLKALREQANALGVDWNVVLRADAAERGSRDRNNLLRLVQRTLPALKAALIDSAGPVLVVHPGLLARFELMPLVSELEARAGRPGHTPSAWLLLPTHQPGVAAIDGMAVPLVNPGATAAVPLSWIENQHRAPAPG